MSVRLKFWFFRNFWWIVILLVVAAPVILLNSGQPTPTALTVLGSLLSLLYFLQKQKLEEMQLFRALFKEFNERYDGMNEELAQIVTSSDQALSLGQIETLIDYFNLCGEEYLYYERRYIDPIVWTAWLNGMKAIVSVKRVGELWAEEAKTNSYYGLQTQLSVPNA